MREWWLVRLGFMADWLMNPAFGLAICRFFLLIQTHHGDMSMPPS